MHEIRSYRFSLFSETMASVRCGIVFLSMVIVATGKSIGLLDYINER